MDYALDVGRVVGVHWGQVAEFHEEEGEGNVVPLQVPVGHGEGRDAFERADPAVGVEEEFEVY